jgi:hypothetical protein
MVSMGAIRPAGLREEEGCYTCVSAEMDDDMNILCTTFGRYRVPPRSVCDMYHSAKTAELRKWLLGEEDEKES